MKAAVNNQKMPDESLIMKISRRLGFEKIAWSLRRLHCPVDRQSLVLEVGSGGNPYYRSNVLLDAYEMTRERHWVPLVADRPTVLGAVENLPFRDNAFDFVIASHVLEHSAEPEKFLSELQRVAKAGYIEVPDAFMERLNPYRDHRLEITLRNKTLVIYKKPAWQVDEQLVELYENRAKKHITTETIPTHPFSFHVRYYWESGINAKIVNPEADASWQALTEDDRHREPSVRSRLNTSALKIFRTLLSQTSRNRAIQLDSILACPSCKSDDLNYDADMIQCRKCSAAYPIKNGMPVMFSNSS